jgi:hypothetical protein
MSDQKVKQLFPLYMTGSQAEWLWEKYEHLDLQPSDFNSMSHVRYLVHTGATSDLSFFGEFVSWNEFMVGYTFTSFDGFAHQSGRRLLSITRDNPRIPAEWWETEYLNLVRSALLLKASEEYKAREEARRQQAVAQILLEWFPDNKYPGLDKCIFDKE